MIGNYGMNLKKVREEERRQENLLRKQKMVEAAFGCFCRQGIEKAAISDIARKAGFGEATLYRYFTNKENLALECGILFWNQVKECITELTEQPEYHNAPGMEQVKTLVWGAFELFQREGAGFCMIYNLDNYLMSHTCTTEKIAEYEAAVDGLRTYLCDALDRGKADGSIGRREDTLELYYALANGIFSMMQKQANGELLESDRRVNQERKTELFLKLLLAGLEREQ